MRSLFAKILLWFLFTVIVTFGVTFYISSRFVRNRPPEFNRLTFELQEARHVWETEGSTGLQAFLARFSETGIEGVLTDGSGRDVITGRDWSRDIRPNPTFGRGCAEAEIQGLAS